MQASAMPLQILRQSHVSLSQKEGTERSDNTREYKGKDRIQHTHLADHQVLRDDEDLYRNHHLEQYKTEAEITALEVQSSKCIACHSCCKNRTHYSEEDQKQCILVQKQEVHVIDNRNKCVFSPYFRENGERIYRCCFRYSFKSCQDHPDKWHKHRYGHNDQYDMY